MTPQERARQIDANEFRRDSAAALQRALAYSAMKRREEAVLVESVKIHMPTQEETRKELSAKLGRTPKLYEHDGKALSIVQWATRLNIAPVTMRRRVLKNGIAHAVALGGLAKSGRRPKTPGVVSNLPASIGTGAGSTARDFAETDFSQKATTE